MSGVIPGTGGAVVTVQDEGSTVVASATKIDFIGTGVVASQDGSDPAKANITVSSGGGGGGSSNSYFPSGW